VRIANDLGKPEVAGFGESMHIGLPLFDSVRSNPHASETRKLAGRVAENRRDGKCRSLWRLRQKAILSSMIKSGSWVGGFGRTFLGAGVNPTAGL
jgi:hypothetical protein